MNTNTTLAMAQSGLEHQAKLAAHARTLAQCWRGVDCADDGSDEDLIAQTHIFLDDVILHAESTADCLAQIVQAQHNTQIVIKNK